MEPLYVRPIRTFGNVYFVRLSIYDINFCFSASAASTVAIDNKIEQAMDLVKSHLMFAVREEVEVLKEKISELMDRINQLEVENSILKANATPDVLQQLPSPGTVIYTNPIPTTSVSTIVKSTPTSAS